MVSLPKVANTLVGGGELHHIVILSCTVHSGENIRKV